MSDQAPLPLENDERIAGPDYTALWIALCRRQLGQHRLERTPPLASVPDPSAA